MSKRGPKRLVTQAVRLGEYGKTKWHIELECGHSVESNRKPKTDDDRLCCKKCLAPDDSSLPAVELFEDGWETDDPLVEVRIRAVLASKVGVTIDQVEMINGTATIFLDAQQVRSLTR